MMVMLRIYMFKRRCGLSRWSALVRTLQSVQRDMKIKRGPRL